MTRHRASKRHLHSPRQAAGLWDTLRPVLLYLPIHLAITAATWRDLRRRPASQIRGSKRLWQVVSALNTLGSLAYLLIGRKDELGHGQSQR